MTNGRLEKPMLIVWLVAGIAYIGGYVDLQRLVHKLGMGATNARSVDLLGELAGVARVVFWVAALAGVVLAVAVVAGGAAARPRAPAVPSTGMRSARRVSSSR